MTTSYSYTGVMPVAAPKKKARTLLPVLTILFVFSYGLMTLLIVEQGRAIQNQHNVIQVLMRDSTELWSAKGKALHQKATAAQPAQPSDPVNGKASSAQAVPPQAPANKKQSNGATRHAPSHKAKPDIQLPPTPAADILDRTRALSTI